MSETLRSKIKSRMESLGIEPKRSLGQNFLVSETVVSTIINSAQLDKYNQLVEIGPGLGALTDHLIATDKDLSLFEMDKTFSQFWRDQDQKVIEGDALKFDWTKYPWNQGPTLLMSNLPYQISSRLVVELSFLNPCFDRMILMFQKEVGQRLVAEEATENYGLLSVVAQIFWRLQFVLEAGAVDFMPKPNVASRVIRFDRKEADDKLRSKAFLNFLKACFAKRRKKLLPQLSSYQPKEELAKIFNTLGFREDIRAEKLSPNQFIELYLALKK